MLHTALALTGVWIGGFAHNGLHMWSRRKAEAITLYVLAPHNPFRWMHKHITGHHMYTNTAFDGDKPVVHSFQRWMKNGKPWMIAVALGVGTFYIGLKYAFVPAEASTMTTLEHRMPLFFVALFLSAGLYCQGKIWIPRYMYTLAIMSAYSFVLFQVAHYQPETLDGDAIHATVDDWVEFQLRTTWGWNQLNRPLLNTMWLSLNLQPGHHIFPAVHHSQLRVLTPMIREYYPGLMEDHHISTMVWQMSQVMLGMECIQK